MPPVAIIAGAALVGAGTNIAASMSNASAAKSAAASNAAAINSNQTTNTGLIDAQKQQNNDAYGQAKTEAGGDITAGAGAANDILRAYNVYNQGYLNDANTANQANADTLASQGQGLFQGNVDRGNAAGSAINALLGIGGDQAAQDAAFKNWTNSTGFQFTLNQGVNAANSSAATKGLLNSGGNLKALSDYGQNTAQTYFGNYLAGLQGQQSTGLSAANALSGVYSNVASLKNNSNTNTANGLVANNQNTSGALANVATGTGNELANVATGTAANVAGSNTSLTGNLVTGNTNATNALVGNTNNALAATTSSNNAAANSVSGLAGNLASGYGLSQGLSSYGTQNALAASPNASSFTPPKIQVGGA